MANLVQIMNVNLLGDLVTVDGTVDSVPETVTTWLSHLNTLGTTNQKKAYCRQLLKARYLLDQATALPTFIDTDPVST